MSDPSIPLFRFAVLAHAGAIRVIIAMPSLRFGNTTRTYVLVREVALAAFGGHARGPFSMVWLLSQLEVRIGACHRCILVASGNCCSYYTLVVYPRMISTQVMWHCIHCMEN